MIILQNAFDTSSIILSLSLEGGCWKSTSIGKREFDKNINFSSLNEIMMVLA